jgi:hypothetical protein
MAIGMSSSMSEDLEPIESGIGISSSYRMATEDENDAAQEQLRTGNEAARKAARRLGIRGNPRIAAARLR